MTRRVQRWPFDPGQRCDSAQRPWMMLRYVRFSNCVLREQISTRSVTVPRWRSSAMVEARNMELLLRQQKSTGVLETNSPPLMPALPLLLSPHILPWHILFLAQSKCALRGRISATSVTVPRRRRSAMVRSKRMRLLLRQPKYTGVLESNSPPLMPAMLLLLSPHILLQQYSLLCPFCALPKLFSHNMHL